jgi:hypothetical protein
MKTTRSWIAYIWGEGNNNKNAVSRLSSAFLIRPNARESAIAELNTSVACFSETRIISSPSLLGVPKDRCQEILLVMFRVRKFATTRLLNNTQHASFLTQNLPPLRAMTNVTAIAKDAITVRNIFKQFHPQWWLLTKFPCENYVRISFSCRSNRFHLTVIIIQIGRRTSSLENQEHGRRNPSRWPRGALYPLMLALTSPTSGGRSVGIVRSRTRDAGS